MLARIARTVGKMKTIDTRLATSSATTRGVWPRVRKNPMSRSTNRGEDAGMLKRIKNNSEDAARLAGEIRSMADQYGWCLDTDVEVGEKLCTVQDVVDELEDYSNLSKIGKSDAVWDANDLVVILNDWEKTALSPKKMIQWKSSGKLGIMSEGMAKWLGGFVEILE